MIWWRLCVVYMDDKSKRIHYSILNHHISYSIIGTYHQYAISKNCPTLFGKWYLPTFKITKLFYTRSINILVFLNRSNISILRNRNNILIFPNRSVANLSIVQTFIRQLVITILITNHRVLDTFLSPVRSVEKFAKSHIPSIQLVTAET